MEGAWLSYGRIRYGKYDGFFKNFHRCQVWGWGGAHMEVDKILWHSRLIKETEVVAIT